MKRLMLCLGLFTLVASGIEAQCSIAVCEETGTYAFSYNDLDEYYTMEELREMSLEACWDYGGTECYTYHESYMDGWWAFMMGYDDDGYLVYAGCEGASSKEEAIECVREEYFKHTGSYGYSVKVSTWYAYSY